MRTLATIYLLHYTLAPLPGARGTDHRLLTGAGGGGGQVYCVLHSAAGGETAPPVTRLLRLIVTTHSDHPSTQPAVLLVAPLIIRSLAYLVEGSISQ